MSTRHYFRATLFHHFYTIWLSANILKSLFVTQRWLCHLFPTITTLKCSFEIGCFFASPAKMVRFLFAVCAEVFLARRASDSEFSHMLSRLLCECLTLIIFSFVVNFSFLELDCCAAAASDYV